MTSNKRILLLILIMMAVAVTVTTTALWVLYQIEFEEERVHLVESAKSQARLMEAVARFNAQFSQNDHPEGAAAATISQIRNAHENYKGFGETGEFTLARREGDMIVFILRHRLQEIGEPKPVPFDSSFAEPMRRALLGRSGSMVGPDYRGVMVLAAHEPVAVLNLGIVAKIDLAEIRASFIKTGAIIAALATVIVLAGTALFFYVGNPMIQAMHESERRFSAIFDQTFQLIGLLKSDGTVIAANRAALDHAGIKLADVVGKPFWDTPWWAHSKEEQIQIHEAVKEAARGKFVRMERTIQAPDGRLIDLDFSLKPVEDDKGNVVLLIPEGWDITERKRGEGELRKLSLAVDQSPAAIIITDIDGTIEYVNRKFAEITGYSAEEAIGQNPRILQSGETPAAVYERLWTTVTAGKEWRGTLRNKRKDGTVYLAGVSIAPITAPDGAITHLIGAQQDITQRVEDERRLKQTEKMESLGGLAGGIAHDFNNMLLPILSLTDMTRKALPEDSRERMRLDKVIEAGTRAKDLVARILAFSRQEDAARENIDIHAAIHETMDLLHSTLPTTIKIKERLNPDTGTVFADRAQVASVLMNLATNAADAMDGETGELTVLLSPVKVGPRKAGSIPNLSEGTYAKLVVKDIGHGMDQKTMEQVMDPFFTTKPIGKGTGLGLSMVHGIVTKNGGAIDISSAPGKGTTVEVYLPLVEEHTVP